MAEFIIIALFIILIITIGIFILLPMYLNNKKVSNGIVNYSSLKYVYKINMSKDQIINRLRLHNAADELDYSLDEENSIIIFKRNGEKASYSYDIRKCNDFCILQINPNSFFPPGSAILCYLNPFWVRKLDAEVVPFSKYGSN